MAFSPGAVTGNNITLAPGVSFANGQVVTYTTTPANFDDSVVGVKIDAAGNRTPAPNTIFFGTEYLKTHLLNTGETIRYHTDNRPLTGLVNDTDYFVINNGDGSISLAATAGGPALAFSVAPTEHALGAALFTSADVTDDSKGGAIKVSNLAALGLSTGDQLTYTAQNGVAIGGLVNGATYFVIIDSTLPDTIRLASTASSAASGIALHLNPNVGSQHRFSGNGPIGGLNEAGRYRVIDNGDGTISLAALSGPLTAITLNTAGVFGTQTLTASPIDLASAANANPQSLTIALKTTANTTKASLIQQGSVSLGTGTADGIATATANAAAFSVLGAGTGSETKVTVNPTVNTFVDKRTSITGKDVSILSSSSADLGTSDTNSTGSFVAATNPLASSSISNSNKAYLGSDVSITAKGKFNLDSRVAQSSNLFVRADAGAGIALAGANNGSQGATILYNNSASVGQNVQINSTTTLDARSLAVTTANLRVEADGKGFGANGKASVFLNAPGTNTTEVLEKAKLSGTVVTLDSRTDAALFVSTDARSAGFASEAVGESTLNATLTNRTDIRGKAVITGSSAVNLNASFGTLLAFNSAFTQTTGVFGGSYSRTFGALNATSVLSAPSDAKFISNSQTRNVQATGVVLPAMNNTVRDPRSIDFGNSSQNATVALNFSDQFAGTVLSFPQPLLALAPTVSAPAGTMLTQSALDGIVGSAVAGWESSGKLDQGQLDKLHQARFQIESLDGRLLGLAAGTDISIDRDAAGYGWFIDKTPTRSEEFGAAAVATKASQASGKMDLLSVVNHEIGHLLGLEDKPSGDTPDFMDDTLAAGERVMPFELDTGKSDSAGAVRVFDERLGVFVTRAKSSVSNDADDDFVRVTDYGRPSQREALYALEAGKWRTDAHKGARP